jgi:transcriptional regulator with XRE-family HTH domain
MRLRKIRQERSLTQEALSRRARISRVYLAEIEGQRRDPSLSIVAKLAKALKVKVGDLVD